MGIVRVGTCGYSYRNGIGPLYPRGIASAVNNAKTFTKIPTSMLPPETVRRAEPLAPELPSA